MAIKKNLTGCTFGILGDSYSTFEGFIPEGNKCYYPRLEMVDDVLRVEDTWWHLLMQRNGMRLTINDSYSGSTVCTQVMDGQPKAAAFTERVKRSFSGDNQPDYIFVFGGTNDNWLERTAGQPQYENWTDEDLAQAIPAFCFVLDYISKRNPDAVIVVILNTYLRPEIHTGIQTAADHYGAVTVALTQLEKKNGHPGALGMRQIADQVQAALENQKD